MGNNSSSENDNDKAAVLFDKISSLTDRNCAKLTGMLLEMPQNDLDSAIRDDEFLKMKLNDAIVSLQCYENDLQQAKERHELLAEALYARVQTVYNDESTAGQITGILLEIGDDSIENLLRNDDQLTDTINRAASVLNINKQSFNPEVNVINKDDIGEAIFNKLTQWCSEEEASKITGMILEMNSEDIIKCSRDETMLKEIANEAKSALNVQM